MKDINNDRNNLDLENQSNNLLKKKVLISPLELCIFKFFDKNLRSGSINHIKKKKAF